MTDEKKARTVTIVSGKGGTGKTSFAAALAVTASPVVLADCDVDAANLHLVLSPENIESTEFYAMPIAEIRQDDCTACGTCRDLCRYDAIRREEGDPPRFVIDPLGCEACLVCLEHCPEEAISKVPRLAGYWYISEARTGPMAHAHLGIAQENSGRLVTEVRKAAATLAEERGIGRVVVDGPPGMGCAVIASLTGTDLALAVTESTLSGMSDLKRLQELAAHFKIPISIVINKADLNPEVTREIRRWSESVGARVLGEIDYDPVVTKAMIQGKAVTELEGPIPGQVRRVCEEVLAMLGRQDKAD